MARPAFKYRLYPNRRQREKLQSTLDVCRELYNAALQERREAWSSHRKGIYYVQQAMQLPDIKPFERTFVRFTGKFCKMRCAGSTRLSRPFFFAASVDKYRGFRAFVPRAATTPSPIRKPDSNCVAAWRYRRLATSRLSCTVRSKAR